MKSFFAAAFLIAAGIGHTDAYAQDALLGTYNGSYTTLGTRGNDVQVGIKLIITRVDNGNVTGTLQSFSSGACGGDFPMAGKFEENKLVMRSTEKGGRAGDCSFSFNAVHEGNKLIGTTGPSGKGRPLQLSK